MTAALCMVVYGAELETNVTMKKRLCMEYKIWNSRHTNILAVIHGLTEPECTLLFKSNGIFFCNVKKW